MFCLLCKQETTNPKFCSHSCAAKYNNKCRTFASRKKQQTTLNQTLIKKSKDVWHKHTFPSTKIYFSPITGQPYNTEIHKNTWHLSSRIISAKRLSKMFSFDLGNQSTLDNINNALNYLEQLYIDEYSPKEICNIFNIKLQNPHTWIMNIINVNKRTISEANTAWSKRNPRQKIIKEPFIQYKLDTKFKFSINEYYKLSGFNLISVYGWYHPIKNPTGVVRDHKISVKFGFDNSIPCNIINHPANCEIIPFLDNCSKGIKCSITLEQLIEDIKNWCG